MDEKELRYLYYDETELKAWYDSQSEELQFDIDSGYQAMIPDFLDYLRKKRYELSRQIKDAVLDKKY